MERSSATATTHPARGVHDGDTGGRDGTPAQRIDRELMEVLNELRVALRPLTD